MRQFIALVIHVCRVAPHSLLFLGYGLTKCVLLKRVKIDFSEILPVLDLPFALLRDKKKPVVLCFSL